jgi:hypothetical protein
VGNHKYIRYVNLEQLQELVAFCQKKHVCEGGESQIHSWYQLDGLRGGVRVEPFPPSRWSTRKLQTTQTTPVQSSLTVGSALALFRIGPELTE